MSANRFIKKSTVSVRNSPVSTFRFNAASGKRFANEIERQGDFLQRVALKEGEKIARKNAKEIALGLDSSKIITTDDEGKPIALQMDIGFGSIGRETFQAAIDERYIQEWNKKLKLKANEIYNNSLLEEHPNAVFKTRMATFINDHVNSVEDSFYNGIVKNIGAEYQAEYAQKYQVTKVQQKIEDITLSKIEAVREAGRAYLDLVNSHGINDPRTVAQKEFFEARKNDLLYKRLVTPAQQLQIENETKIGLAGAAHEKIISYLISGKVSSKEMKEYHLALGTLSEINPIIKRLKKEHPEIANEIRTLYANTDDIGFKNERDKLQNASGGLITDTEQNRSVSSSLAAQEVQLTLDEDYNASEQELLLNQVKLLEEVRNEIAKLTKTGDFDTVDKLKKQYLKDLNYQLGIFNQNSMNRISPTLYKKLSAEDKTLLEKQESTRKNIFTIKFKNDHVRFIDRQFELFKLQGKLEYHLSNQELGTLYEGFTKDYLAYLRTGEEQLKGSLPQDIITSIDLIRNGKHWPQHQKQIIQEQEKYFNDRKAKIEQAEKDHTTVTETNFTNEINLVFEKALGFASDVFIDTDIPNLPPELTAGKSISDMQFDAANNYLEIVFDQMDKFANLKTTSKEYKRDLTLKKQNLKDNLYSEIFKSYVSNINGTTDEGMNQLVNLQKYFQAGSGVKGQKKQLDDNNMEAVKNIYEQISSQTQQTFETDVQTLVKNSIQNATPTDAQLRRINAFKLYEKGGVYFPDAIQSAVQKEIIDNNGWNLTDDWGNDFFTLTQINSFYKQNSIHDQVKGQLYNFLNKTLPDDQMIQIYNNLQKLTSFIGNQGQPFNVEIHKVFANEDLRPLANDIEAILIGANTLEIPVDEIPKFIGEVSNFNLRGEETRQFTKDKAKEIYDDVRKGLLATGMYQSQIDQALGTKVSNFIIERVANLVLNKAIREGKTEFQMGDNYIQKLTTKGVIQRIQSEHVPNNESEALITGQFGPKTVSNNNINATFANPEKEESFLRTISNELLSDIKPVDSNKKFVLAKEYKQTIRSLKKGTKLEEYKRDHIPVFITPNFMIKGRYPMFMAMVQDKDKLLVPLIGKHLIGEQKDKIGFATWDSEKWDYEWNEAAKTGVFDFSDPRLQTNFQGIVPKSFTLEMTN